MGSTIQGSLPAKVSDFSFCTTSRTSVRKLNVANYKWMSNKMCETWGYHCDYLKNIFPRDEKPCHLLENTDHPEDFHKRRCSNTRKVTVSQKTPRMPPPKTRVNGMRHTNNKMTKLKLNSVALVRTRTIPTERPPPVGEVTANFCG